MSAEDRVQIEIRLDGLEAWAKVASGDVVEGSAAESVIRDNGISLGVDKEGIRRVDQWLATTVSSSDEACVARGVLPKSGNPEVLELEHADALLPGTLRDDGTLDYRERDLIVPVEEGEVLGRVLSATEGEPGVDVFGKPVAVPDAESLELKTGDGIKRDAAGVLTSNRRGAWFVALDGTLDVVECHVHSGGVDLTTGNLRTKGSLEVARDVSLGMRVEASRDISIKGAIDGAQVRAGGAVQVQGGAIGRDGGSIQAGTDLEVRHALGITLFAQGTIRITRSASDSKLMAAEVEVGGHLLGGQVFAETRIDVSDAGSAAGGPCHLRAAYPLPSDPIGESGALPLVDAALIGKPVVSLGARKGRRSRASSRGSSGRSARKSAGSTGAAVSENLVARLAWRRRERELQKTAVIQVRGKAYAGCRIDFGARSLVLEKTANHCAFRFDRKKDKIVKTEI
ncbi:MAG: DUF342 domain-containing protein [Myxococcota bacterium]